MSDDDIGLPCKVCGRESTHDRLVWSDGSNTYESYCREHAPDDADAIDEYFAVRTWRFRDAPKRYRDLCPGWTGDGWLVHVPAEFDAAYPAEYIPAAIRATEIRVYCQGDGGNVYILELKP